MTDSSKQEKEAPAKSAGLDLDTVIADARRVGEKELEEQEVLFSGHPAAAAPISATVDDEDGAAQPDDNEPSQSTGSSGESSQTPAGDQPAADDAGAPDASEGAGGAEAAKPDAQGSKKFRFKDHAAAEEAYSNLHSQYGKSQTELVKFREREKKASDAKAAAEAAAEFDGKLEEVSRKETAEALKKINGLDPESEDYDEQVAAAWAHAHTKINQFVREHTPRSAPAAQDAADGRQPDARDTADTQPPAADDAGGEDPAWVYAKEQARSNGIDPEDPVFIHFGNQVKRFDTDGKERSLEDMVDEVVKSTKTYHDNARERFAAEQKEEAEKVAQRQQLANQPMGASPAVPRTSGAKTPVKRLGISDALSAANAERRL